MTLFEQCVAAVDETDAAIGVLGWTADDGAEVVRAVLNTVQANTGSPRTVEEIGRILSAPSALIVSAIPA